MDMSLQILIVIQIFYLLKSLISEINKLDNTKLILKPFNFFLI